MESYSVITGNELMKWTNAQHGLMDESKNEKWSWAKYLRDIHIVDIHIVCSIYTKTKNKQN